MCRRRRAVEETAVVDISPSAQIRDIQATFDHIDKGFDLASLKHPTKPDITAVESYEILPDADIWANAYDLFRFAERPGDRPLDVRFLPFVLSSIIIDKIFAATRSSPRVCHIQAYGIRRGAFLGILSAQRR